MYLVTGAAGFIGRSIAAESPSAQEEVRGIDNLSTGKIENLASLQAMEFIEAGLSDANAVARPCEGVDVIFHEAALASVPRSVKDPSTSDDANVSGTLRLLIADAAAGVKRVVYAGSPSAYGETPTHPRWKRCFLRTFPHTRYRSWRASTTCSPSPAFTIWKQSPYAIFNAFGPHQGPTSQYSGVLAKFTSQTLANEIPTNRGDGEQAVISPSSKNVVNANLLAAHAPAEMVLGRVFNIATNSSITLNRGGGHSS